MNRSWVRFPQAAQIRPPGSGWALLCALLVACGPTGVPGAAWLALMGRAAVCAGGRRPAREIATRAPEGSEWSISRPALALPPPTGTAARPRVWRLARAPGPSGALHTCGAWCADVWLCASARCPARPRCRPRAPQPGPPAPSTPVGRVVLMRIHIIAKLPQFRMQFPRDSFKS